MEGPLMVSGWLGTMVHPPERLLDQYAWDIRFDSTRAHDGLHCSGHLTVTEIGLSHLDSDREAQNMVEMLRDQIRHHLQERTHCKCRVWLDPEHNNEKYFLNCEKHSADPC